MPNCEKYRELCSASIDSELSLEEKRELSEHLSECPACAAYLDDLREMRNAWDDFKQPLPDDMHEHIMQAVLKEAQKPTKKHFPVFTTLAAAAACVMLVLSGAIGDIMSMTSNNSDKNNSAKPTGKLVMEDTKEDETPYVEPEQTEPVQPEKEEQTEQYLQSEQVEPVQPRTVEPKQEQQQTEEVTPKITEQPQTEQPQQKEQKTNNVAPATFSINPEVKKNTAESQSVEIPSGLQTSSFAFCFVAVGSGDLPVIENAEFIEKNNNIYYFKVTGAISDFDTTIKELQEKGFETTMREDLGVKIDANASNGLLVVVVNE